MKKYNCNNTLDYAHECTRMCKTFLSCSGCPLRDMFCAMGNATSEHIKRVQEWSDNHPEVVLTDEQREVLKALNLLGFRYIAKDKDNDIYVYFEPPQKKDTMWVTDNSNYFEVRESGKNVYGAISPLVNWSDIKPLDIEKMLK